MPSCERRRQALRVQLQRLCQLPLMRGSVVERVRRCGRPGCACASDPGARHPGQYLSVSLHGRTQVVHLRPADAAAVREAIAGYERLWATLTALTAFEVQSLRPSRAGAAAGTSASLGVTATSRGQYRQGILPFVIRLADDEQTTARAGLPLVVEALRAVHLDEEIASRVAGSRMRSSAVSS